MRKIFFAMIGTLSIATAVIAHPAITHVTEGSPTAAVAAAAGYGQARILEPGSRRNVVEI
jgi:hypothetical protein